MEIPGTREQSASKEWYTQRFTRLTASKCKKACNIGKLVCDEASDAAVRAYNFIKSNVWKIDDSEFQSYWMRYGIESEPHAIKKYEGQTNANVYQTGLWVNPKFQFLACSPDGLVNDNRLLEIKSLKVLKNNTIEDITSGTVKISNETEKNQCFSVEDGKCVLHKKHAYYYQVQMQLLVTEREFCDFILYAKEGEVSIETIFRNESLINEILKYLTAFWFKVLAPEIFEMRVPPSLNPFILQDIDMNITHCQKHGTLEKDVEYVSDFDTCKSEYTREELNVCGILDNTLKSPIRSLCLSTTDLLVVP